MSDYISRQAAIEVIDAVFPVDSMKSEYALAKTYIEQLPSAQPKIIRCKDCLYWIPGYITDQDGFIPPKCGKYQQMVGHSAEDFCSHAERRADDGE